MTTKLIVRLGNPGPVYPQQVGISRTFLHNTKQSVGIARTFLYNVASPATAGARFYGDPGVGNTYVGMEVQSSQIVNFQHYENQLTKPARLTHPTQLRRFYDSGGTIAEMATDMARCVSDGCIPVQDILMFQTHTPGDFVAGINGTPTWMSDLAALINAQAPMPVVIGAEHEPYHGPKFTVAQAPAVRADQRVVFSYLRAHCPNVVLAGPCWQFDEFNPPRTARDWRIVDMNWNGTTAPGSSVTNPSSVDWADISYYDVLMLDEYNWWGDYVNGVGSNSWQVYRSLASQWNAVYNTLKSIDIYTNMPWFVGEYGTIAYCGDDTHGGASATDTGNFGAANHNTFLTELSDFHAIPLIAGYCYWNSRPQTPNNWDGGSTKDTDPFNWHLEAFNAFLQQVRVTNPVQH